MQDLASTFSPELSASDLDPVTADDSTFDHDVQKHIFFFVNYSGELKKKYMQIIGYIKVSLFPVLL